MDSFTLLIGRPVFFVDGASKSPLRTYHAHLVAVIAQSHGLPPGASIERCDVILEDHEDLTWFRHVGPLVRAAAEPALIAPDRSLSRRPRSPDVRRLSDPDV